MEAKSYFDRSSSSPIVILLMDLTVGEFCILILNIVMQNSPTPPSSPSSPSFPQLFFLREEFAKASCSFMEDGDYEEGEKITIK